MPELLSPFAPVHNWLCRALRIGWDGSRLQTRGLAIHFREPPQREELDLRDFITRAVTLRALAEAGHPRPWALGSCWSSLTDEQAGRVVAETIRRVGEDPGKPCGVVPIGVLGPREVHTGAGLYPGVARYGRPILVGKPPMPTAYGWVNNRKPSSGREHMLQTWFCGGDSGPEKGDAGIAASEACAMSKGALLWEQITPPEKSDA